MFQPKLLKKWTDEQIEQMRGAIFVAEHRLTELPLFKDEELIRVLDKHPRKDLGVNTMGGDPARRSDWQEGDAGDLDGKTLLEITKRKVLARDFDKQNCLSAQVLDLARNDLSNERSLVDAHAEHALERRLGDGESKPFETLNVVSELLAGAVDASFVKSRMQY